MRPRQRTNRAKLLRAAERPAPAMPAPGSGSVVPEKTDEARHRNAYAVLASHQAGLLQVIAVLLEASRLTSAAMAICDALQQRFTCTRVAVGLFRGGSWTAAAISQQAHIDQDSPEVLRILAAMQEATRAECSIRFPSGADRSLLTQHHEAIRRTRGSVELLTIPLIHQDKTLGAIYLERDSAWTQGGMRWMEQLAVAVAPLLHLRDAAEQSALGRARTQLRSSVDVFRQPRRIVFKTAMLGALILVPLMLAMPVTHTVTASSELVSLQKRLITAPQIGYVSNVLVNSGDTVTEGQLLVQLDRGDLELERTRRQNEMRAADAEFRLSMANHDRKAMAVARAGIEKARAELALIDQRLSRVEVRAPYAGVIVGGDLSQAVGAPVERGDTLFEISPDTGYQVRLWVDEMVIGRIAAGQAATLALRAAPGDALHLKVDRIHPIAEARDGSSVFRVDAEVMSNVRGLKPGQTGIGRIDVGSARLGWVWTHSFWQWIQLNLWKWFG